MIYEIISCHNKKFNEKEMFLSTELLEKDNAFYRFFIPFSLIASLTGLAVFSWGVMIQSVYLNRIAVLIFSSIGGILFFYHFFYFNLKAKEETSYIGTSKLKGIDFFNSWFTPKFQMEKIRRVSYCYSLSKMNTEIQLAELEYDRKKASNKVSNFESVFVGLCAFIAVSILGPLQILNDWLLKINGGKEITFDLKLYVFKVAVGLIIMFICTYIITKWNFFNRERNFKRNRLSFFLETLILAQGMKRERMFNK